MVGSIATTTHRHPSMDAAGDEDDDVDQAIESSSSLVSCSICLDSVSENGSRSTAKLHCGHQFHLDCIGSAFNMKGAMQCPNCRKVEKGQWLYANGSARSLPEFSMEDWIPDEDFYDLSYSEMPFRVHWCPFGELARVGSSFEEVEPPSTTYHDLRGHHPIFAEQEAASMAHSYVAYVGPVPPTTSRSSNNVDDPLLNYHWNGASGHNEIFPSHAFPATQYHSWDRHSPPFSVSSSHINGADPASVPPATLRSFHGESDAVTMSRSFPHPFVFDHGSGPRVGSSFVSSVVPRHPGSTAVNLERIQTSHSFLPQQQSSNSSGLPTPVVPGLRRFDGPRSLPAVVPVPPQHDQNGNFYIFPPSSSGQNLQEAESPFLNRFHARERERLSRFPAVIRDSSWGSFHQTSGASDLGNRPGSFWHRHSS